MIYRFQATFSDKIKIQTICIFNHHMIYQICDVMMNITTIGRVHSFTYLLSHDSLSHLTWSIDRYKQGHKFSGIFWTIWRSGAKFQVLFRNLLQLLNNQLCPDSIKGYIMTKNSFVVEVTFW